MIDENESLSDEQIDNLVNESESSPNREIPMSDKDVESQPTEQKTEAELLFEFQHNGKAIKANRDQMVKYASMGYDYPQKMQEFNKQKMAFEAQQREYEEKYSPYREINEWAEKSPQEWQRLQQLYSQFKNGQVTPQLDPTVAPYIQKYEQELGEVKNFIQTQREKEQAEYRQKQDQQLDLEMKSIRENYKDLDFDTPNEEGKSLDYLVLEYAKNNGIKSYKTAFNDFYLPNLLNREKTLAKQEVSKGIQKNSKLGVLGTKSPTQGRTYSEPQNIKNKSYEDIQQEILRELGIS